MLAKPRLSHHAHSTKTTGTSSTLDKRKGRLAWHSGKREMSLMMYVGIQIYVPANHEGLRLPCLMTSKGTNEPRMPPGCLRSHDMRQRSIQMAFQMCTEPRYVTGAHPNGLPDVSRATICDRGASKWPSRCVPSYDMRQGCIQMDFQMCPEPQCATRAHPNGLPDVSKTRITTDRRSGKQAGAVWAQPWAQPPGPPVALYGSQYGSYVAF